MSYSRTSEPFKLERNVAAIRVPQGEAVDLPAGSVGYITQALGGSFTIYLEGNLFRIANEDADALGKEPIARPTLPEGASDDEVEKLIWTQLRSCYDPEISVNIVDLGLVYEARLERLSPGERKVHARITLTAPGCGMGDTLIGDVRRVLEEIPTVVEADVELTFDPPWNQTMMSEEARLETGMMY